MRFYTFSTITSSGQEAERVVLDALLGTLAKVLSVDVADLDRAQPMHAYGVDSLVAVELRAWMAQEIESDIRSRHVCLRNGERVGSELDSWLPRPCEHQVANTIIGST